MRLVVVVTGCYSLRPHSIVMPVHALLKLCITCTIAVVSQQLCTDGQWPDVLENVHGQLQLRCAQPSPRVCADVANVASVGGE